VLDYCEKDASISSPGLQSIRVASRTARSTTPHGATPSQIALASLLKRSPVMLPIPGTRRSRTWKKMSPPLKSGYRMKSSPALIAKGGQNSAELETGVKLMARSRQRLDTALTLKACQSTRCPTKLESFASSPTRRDRTNRHGHRREITQSVSAHSRPSRPAGPFPPGSLCPARRAAREPGPWPNEYCARYRTCR